MSCPEDGEQRDRYDHMWFFGVSRAKLEECGTEGEYGGPINQNGRLECFMPFIGPAVQDIGSKAMQGLTVLGQSKVTMVGRETYPAHRAEEFARFYYFHEIKAGDEGQAGDRRYQD